MTHNDNTRIEYNWYPIFDSLFRANDFSFINKNNSLVLDSDECIKFKMCKCDKDKGYFILYFSLV